MPSPRRSSRREFVQGLGRAAGVGALASTFGALALEKVHAAVAKVATRAAGAVAGDEDFWLTIQDAWDADRALLNLNNGGCSPAPRAALDALFRMWRFANQTMYHNLMAVLDPQKEAVREQLAGIFGASPETIAIVRNASEALETVTLGLELKPGDVVLSTTHDYPRMVTTWKQRALRDGIVFKQLPMPVPVTSPDEIVALFEQNITPQTKVMHFCQAIFMTGQLLPVQKLCRLARSRGILSIVDGAHAFAHLDFKADELECDFYGTSLHKWLAAPVGNGMLHVRKELIPSIWPLFAHDQPRCGDIRKFEQFGTHPVPIFLSIAESARLHVAIGAQRKQERLRFLRDAWAKPLLAEPNVKLLTSLAPEHSCGIATMAIEGVDPGKFAEYLLKKCRIVVAPINFPGVAGGPGVASGPGVAGIRVTPHVYTTLPEIDRFVGVVRDVARHGIPS
jgi:selenocysteine lyase/cysteine desulfurase